MNTLNKAATIIERLLEKKKHHSKMISFFMDQYLDSDLGEGDAFIVDRDIHIGLFTQYRLNINRYYNNELANKYSKFKHLGKKPIVDFSTIPKEESLEDAINSLF